MSNVIDDTKRTMASTMSTESRPVANNHISVDCVVLGFDGERMSVLLIKRAGEENGQVFHDMKLPGSLIYMDEDLDEAASRVLAELTGLKKIPLLQFKAFGSKDRTKDPKDVHWLERAEKLKIDRIVTVAYVALIRIDRALTEFKGFEACWVPLDEVPVLAFDHNAIVREAERYVGLYAVRDPQCMFKLLPRKFTVPQLRKVYRFVTGNEIDARNFYKKLAVMPYVVPMVEKEKGVAHRAARFYRFDSKMFKKTRI